MEIGALFPTLSSSADANATEASNELGKEDFLKLLIAQLENQNPLKPQEATEFTSQLVQFTSLEKLIDIDKSLGDAQSIQFSLHNAQATSMIGKTILSLGNEISVQNALATNIEYELTGDASVVNINIYDSSNNLLRTVSAGSQSAGRQSVPFDGLDKNGSQLPDGIYAYQVLAETIQGDAVPSTLYSSSGKVNGVSYEDGTAVLLVGNNKIPVNEIVEVLE